MAKDRTVAEIFARNLTYYLESHHKTRSELAKYCGVSVAAVTYWTKGDKLPKAERLTRIANFFGVTTDDLLAVNLKADQEQMLLTKRKEELASIANDASPEELEELLEVTKALVKIQRARTFRESANNPDSEEESGD